MKRDVFIETANVAKAWKAIRQAEDTEKGRPGMVALWGAAGLGKTFAARRAVMDGGGCFMRVCENMSQSAFLQELAAAVGGKAAPRNAASCRRLITAVLEERLEAGECATIYLDEADRLALSRFEDARDLHDCLGCPVVFLGETRLLSLLENRDRIIDRIPDEYRIAFGKLSPEDVMLYADEAAGLAFDPAARSRAATAVRGNFRRLHNLLLSVEAAAKAARTREIDAEFLGKVLGHEKKDRKGEVA